MGFVDGLVLRDRADGRGGAEPSAARRAAGESHRRHAGRHPRRRPRRRRPGRPRPPRRLHRPPAQALVRPVERSRRRASCPPSTRSTTRSAPASPSRARRAIVHGDYRLDNCMVDADGDVLAVLDWEICTLGDPLADVGLLHGVLDRARRRADGVGRARPPRRPASPTAPTLLDRYAEVSGRDLASHRLLRRVRASGSWPASWRASTPATSAARWAAAGRRRARRRSSVQVERASRPGRRARGWSACR